MAAKMHKKRKNDEPFCIPKPKCESPATGRLQTHLAGIPHHRYKLGMSDLLSSLHNQLSPHAGLDVQKLRGKLADLAGGQNGALHIYPHSAQVAFGTLFFMVRSHGTRWLVVFGDKSVAQNFEGETAPPDGARCLTVCPLTPRNANALRGLFGWLKPRTFGLKPTFGCGDRLGLATPGHIHAARACGVNVLLAQQSIREMARTQRTPTQVMDDAMWGVFQEGYTEGFGSDADHLKTFQDIETTAAVGFTMFTIDPSEFVDRAADAATEKDLDASLVKGDSKELPVPVAELTALYSGRAFDIPGMGKMEPSALEVKRAIVKYGRAVAHTERMARHIAKVMAGRPYDLEMSVDETDNPTTPVEHLFVGLELRRRKITVHSLALRFIGEFQKGIDYIGDLKEFEKSFARQFAIATFCGPYKMSIHSGSDKFSIFPIIGRIAGPLVHEKTAGTSYLEALRAVAKVQPGLFREICAFALQRYDTDRATYHVAEKLDRLPSMDAMADGDLEKIFDNDHGRQLLHVTFGSVLNEKSSDGRLKFKDRIFQVLRDNEELYSDLLKGHFSRHMRSLAMATR